MRFKLACLCKPFHRDAYPGTTRPCALQRRAYIYQKQTNITYKVKNIKADSSQYNLPVLANFGISRKGDRFYKPQKAGDLLTFFEKNKSIPVPKELEDFLKSNPPAASPVIVEFKLKN